MPKSATGTDFSRHALPSERTGSVQSFSSDGFPSMKEYSKNQGFSC